MSINLEPFISLLLRCMMFDNGHALVYNLFRFILFPSLLQPSILLFTQQHNGWFKQTSNTKIRENAEKLRKSSKMLENPEKSWETSNNAQIPRVRVQCIHKHTDGLISEEKGLGTMHGKRNWCGYFRE